MSLVSCVQVSEKWFSTHQPQPGHRVKLSIQQTLNLRQVQTNHESMTSESLCECPHCESAQHQHRFLMHLDLLSIRLLNERLHSEAAQVHKKLDSNHFAQPSLCIKYRTNTRQRDLVYKPWTGNCWEPSIYTRSINTHPKKRTDDSCSWKLSMQPDLLALLPYKSWQLG